MVDKFIFFVLLKAQVKKVLDVVFKLDIKICPFDFIGIWYNRKYLSAQILEFFIGTIN
jgi:hypothetical protein